MAFAPHPSDCEHVFNVLIACVDPQHQHHKAAIAELQKSRSTPTFAACAAAVFAGGYSAAQAPENIRELAGIELKNAMKVCRRPTARLFSSTRVSSRTNALSCCRRQTDVSKCRCRRCSTSKRLLRPCCSTRRALCAALLPASSAGERNGPACAHDLRV